MKFVSDLQQVGGILLILPIPLQIKVTTMTYMYILVIEIVLKAAINL
jgi:hypothetical protein